MVVLVTLHRDRFATVVAQVVGERPAAQVDELVGISGLAQKSVMTWVLARTLLLAPSLVVDHTG
jgi:hypothetical protein